MSRPGEVERRLRCEEYLARILVVDDDAVLLRGISRRLRHAGYDVLEAADGQRAMELLREVTVDLTIVDIFMPGMDGMELTARVRERMPGAKIIGMSGGGTVGKEETLQIARRFGAARTLAKPFTSEELLAAVAELLGEVPSESRHGSSSAR